MTSTRAALDDKLLFAASKCFVNYGFFIGATAENLAALGSAKRAYGSEIFMGSSHCALLVSTETEIEPIFFAKVKRLIAFHAEDRAIIIELREEFVGISDIAVNSFTSQL